MKHFFSICCILLSSHMMFGQKDTVIEKGTATYVSSQNVYVKFTTTENINKGDTLFSKNGEQFTPSLLVKDKSSTSCVCSSMLSEKVKVSDEFYAKSIVEKKQVKSKPQKEVETKISARDSSIKTTPMVITPDDKDAFVVKQIIKGRISAAAYSDINGGDVKNRMRYTLSFQDNNIKNSHFSTDSYISFRHTIGEWQEVKDHFTDALKVYSLSVKYDFDKKTRISLGRRINERISSMGAIDGIQAEKGFGHFMVGAIAGSRPDYADYSINLQLFQAGAYVGYATQNQDKSQESTFAFVEQRNQSKTDRRFIYFQHSNNLLRNLNFFGSCEVDLYQNVDNKITNNPSLTNLLLSLRYRISKKLNISAEYDNRKNIIYYESYKSYIDQLIEDETRQGMRVGVNYQVTKSINWGTNVSWRFQKSELNLSKNLNSYLNFNRIPFLNATASVSLNILQTSYLDSKIVGARISKELIRGKLNGEVTYRWVDYNYKTYENKVSQHVAGIDLSWNITRKLAFYLYYEGTFEQQTKTYTRINTRIIQRF